MRKLNKAIIATAVYFVALFWLEFLMNGFRYSYMDGYIPQILGLSSFAAILAVIAFVPSTQCKLANAFAVSAGIAALALWYFSSDFGYANITYYNAKTYSWEAGNNLQLLYYAIPIAFAVVALSAVALARKRHQ